MARPKKIFKNGDITKFIAGVIQITNENEIYIVQIFSYVSVKAVCVHLRHTLATYEGD